MSEALSRLTAAWAVLRGHAVIRGVAISYGEVDVRRPRLLVNRGEIRKCQVWTLGPVILRPDKTSVCAGNEGSALIGTVEPH